MEDKWDEMKVVDNNDGRNGTPLALANRNLPSLAVGDQQEPSAHATPESVRKFGSPKRQQTTASMNS